MSSSQAIGRVLHDAMANPAFAQALLNLIREREHVHNEHGKINSIRLAAIKTAFNHEPTPSPVIHNTDEGNVTAIFHDKLVLKFFRRLGTGVNPECEIGSFLTEKEFPHSPKLAGALEYESEDQSQLMTIAVAKTFVPYAKNAWKFTIEAVTRYYDRVFADASQGHTPEDGITPGPLKLLQSGLPLEAGDQVGTYLESARLLGERGKDRDAGEREGARGR